MLSEYSNGRGIRHGYGQSRYQAWLWIGMIVLYDCIVPVSKRALIFGSSFNLASYLLLSASVSGLIMILLVSPLVVLSYVQ